LKYGNISANQLSDIKKFIAAAMVWHSYLLTTNDENHFTGEALAFCGGKRSAGLQLPWQGMWEGSRMTQLWQQRQDVDCRRATD
jgi:hypothetical protein